LKEDLCREKKRKIINLDLNVMMNGKKKEEEAVMIIMHYVSEDVSSLSLYLNNKKISQRREISRG
jgi:hypothetical protein